MCAKRLATMFGLEKILSPDTIKKGIEKINPKMKQFFQASSKYGYPVGAALGFLRSEFGGGKASVDQGLRPDEAANLEIARQKQAPQRLAQTALNIGGGAALGGLAGGAATMLGGMLGQQGDQQTSQEIPPQDQQQEGQPQRTGGAANFIAQHPELGTFLDQQMAKGMSVIQAATEARKVRKLLPMIQNIEQNIGQPLEDILTQLFQGQQQGAQQQPQASAQGQQQGGEKSSFLQALGELQQAIQGLRR